VKQPSGTVAAFDLDGTLTRRDTMLPFVARVCGWSAVGRTLARHAVPLTRMAVGRADRDQVKEGVLAPLLGGRRLADLESIAEAYAGDVVADGLQADVAERVRRHLDAGHEVVIVSASPALYVAPIGRRLGAAAVLATELEMVDGVLTGRLLGRNCRGPEKVDRLRTWLDGRTPVLHAYGDSSGDRELLAWAEFSTRVGRRSTLHPLA
jgi:phosphatidylglycerophosphatase C